MNRINRIVQTLCLAVLGLVVGGGVQAQPLALEAALVSSGAGTSEAGTLVADLTVGQPAVGRVAQGTFEVELSFVVVAEGGNVSTDPGAAPLAFELEASYPNPFASSAIIAYTLPEASEVQVEVFDVLGRRVRSLADGEQAAGRHTVTFEAQGLPSGVYVYRLKAGTHTATRRMQLVR